VVSAVALQGQTAPGPSGGTYGGSASPFGTLIALNGAGQVAFGSALTGGTATSGLFAGSAGSVSAVALQGQSAPGGSGETYSSFSSGAVLNGSGQVAFRANLSGGPSTQGIFTKPSGGSVSAVALLGQSAPGTSAGVTYSTFGTGLVLNGSGQVGYTAVLAGTGVTAANDGAVYAGTAGNVQLVVREGDTINTTAGTKTVSTFSLATGSGGEDGRAWSYNDAGIMAMSLTFTDGASGIYLFTPVPEPGLILGFAAAGLAGARWVRRRRVAVTPAGGEVTPPE
jgi:hypothetical protein